MLQSSKYIIFFFFLLPSFIWGQECNISLRGKILNEKNKKGITEVRLGLKELQSITYTDDQGNFSFERLCPGSYHFELHHIAFENTSHFIEILHDTLIIIEITPLNEYISEVELVGDQEKIELQSNESIHTHSDYSKLDNNLARSLTDMAGVSVIGNGSSISKPVIHGLWGNRVSIINNGIAQSGQQWGSDHAPEIDPFIADHITVLKGSSALAYPGSNLGGVVLVEAEGPPKDPHLHGGFHYSLQTNGWGNTANLKLEKSAKGFDWRFLGTIKYFGDRKSPNYFLTNTGNRESNAAISLFKDFSKNWKNSFYYSFFKTELGILKGSHINNITDLEQAINSETPLYTKDYFTYDIEAPRQEVTHHLLKWDSRLKINESTILKFKYGGQLNQRNEYDIRRAGRSDMPSLSLEQWSHFLESRFTHIHPSNMESNGGIQYTYLDNTNDNSGTGRLPLIPDYVSHQLSLFGYQNIKQNRFSYEYGLRVNSRYLDVRNITRTVPRKIERIEHTFLDLNLSGSAVFQWNRTVRTGVDLGWVQRQPEINELYSNGLHQGVASIEYGNPNLNAERSFKTMINVGIKVQKNFFIELDSYFDLINDYIFLNPTGEFETTISGSFPIFQYDQTHARIIGSDLSAQYKTENWDFLLAMAWLQGDDLSKNTPLIYMPANNLFAQVGYSWIGNKWNQTEIKLNGKLVASQNHFFEGQDFIPPPDGYFLLGAGFKRTRKLGKNNLEIFLNADNLLNVVYRDYLNRLRYFADEPGINLKLGFRLLF